MSSLSCLWNVNGWKKPNFLEDMCRASSKVERRNWIMVPCCYSIHWSMKSHRIILTHMKIYFMPSKVYASNITWPVSRGKPDKTSQVALFYTVDFVVILASCSGHWMMYSGWCLQNHGEGAAVRHYRLSWVPASRGHCCSINFSKRLAFDICCASLAWWLIEVWKICYIYKRTYFCGRVKTPKALENEFQLTYLTVLVSCQFSASV